MGVHPEARRRVDLDDPPAGLAERKPDVRTDEVDAGDIEPHDARGKLGDLDVVGMGLFRAVDADTAGAHVAGPSEVDPLPARRSVGELESLLARVGDCLLVELDAGQDLLVADAAPRIRVRDVDELCDAVLPVALAMGRDALRD